ncbi:hypothetical protein NP233_g12696 [Leucocoprinus birnbaumii]|uniref:Uncharacterized protein n=1 Tax=Leucocoprinus birnbaumii TaxID=56174 RepID=A0AAD5VFY9_9AGAR|nr:hypothetical protein NP233_g12696 [Leucocoprinus birnbaumii]
MFLRTIFECNHFLFFLSTMKLSCDGCLKFFQKERDYEFHGQFSKSLACQEAYQGYIHTTTQATQASVQIATLKTINVNNTGDSTNGFDVALPAMDIDVQVEGLGAHVEPMVVEEEISDLNEIEAIPSDAMEEELVAEQENDWEPTRSISVEDVPQATTANDDQEDNGLASYLSEARQSAEHVLINAGHGPEPKSTVRYSQRYPDSKCGAPIAKSLWNNHDQSSSNPYAPFNSKLDWEVAQWAKLHGPGATALTKLLAVDGVREALGLSFKNTDELNNVIDADLAGRPQFHRREVVVGGESFEFFSRDILECIKSIWKDPQFANELIVEPEHHYTDEDETVRMYHDMHTGKWWWNTQKALERMGKKQCTIIPVMLSSDKTQLTQFRNKQAYPVYLTIGNLPKHIRRKPSRQGQILLAYLPTTKLEHITNLASRRCTLTNLFHVCMKFIVQPLETAGANGEFMCSSDGLIRCCFPILATYIGDYPEQVLVSLVKTGVCPSCDAPRDGIGDPASARAPRKIRPILEALDKLEHGAHAFVAACTQAGIKTVPSPFWKDLPFVNIYSSITPNVLHQLYQGVVKHLISWIIQVCGRAEIDARCRRLPMNHHICLFMKGISGLSRVTGTEHDQICRFLLGIVQDIRLPGGQSNGRLIRSVWSLLDFVYLARYPIHTTNTLDHLKHALFQFHENAAVFVDLKIRPHLNFPKLHFCGHYQYLIELFGTTDNYNTEYTERLHIDLAKDAYRATNFRDEVPQMTIWLDRKECVLQHARTVQERLNHDNPPASESHIAFGLTTPIKHHLPCLVYRRTIQLPKNPSVTSVTLDSICRDYGASLFKAAICQFVAHHQNPTFNAAQIEKASYGVDVRFNKVPVYHYLKFTSHDPYALPSAAPAVIDSIYAKPGYKNKKGESISGRFDTAMVNHTHDQSDVGNIQGE